MSGVSCFPKHVSIFYNLDISPYRPLEEQLRRLKAFKIMTHPDKQNHNNTEAVTNATYVFQILAPYKNILRSEFSLRYYIKESEKQIQKWDEARERRMQQRYGGMKPWFFSYNPDPKSFLNWAELVDSIHAFGVIFPFPPDMVDSFWSSEVFRVGEPGKHTQVHMYDEGCREFTLDVDSKRWNMPTWTSRGSEIEYTKYDNIVKGKGEDLVMKYIWVVLLIGWSIGLLTIWLLFKFFRYLFSRYVFSRYVVVGESRASKSIGNGEALKRRTSRASNITLPLENETGNTVPNQPSQTKSTISNQPSQTESIASDQQIGNTISNQPSQTESITSNQSSQTKNTASNQPSQTENTTSNQPSQKSLESPECTAFEA
ncbi:2121eb71-8647-4110-9586-32729d2dec5e-CDS [Sclerotinia trifoliorum]|uniref:2121eb71-8647-4110-9586-32729d2dec5e-CDS n=1 Tax=Sclerotinia trifoliorum TaxID=28548 RepID=A0A8H2ZVH4_9HELO|nr:2121eb71-8647-4110-9586-32729d2dec5e-CDS [Sclerotinia trifoliorum]